MLASVLGKSLWNFWELDGNPGWVQQLHLLETCLNNEGVACLNVMIKTGSCIKTRWPKHSPPAWFQFSWYLYFDLFETCGGKVRAEIRQRLLHSRILLGRTRSPELQTWRSRQWRGKHQGEPSLRCWCASNCQIPKKQLSIKSATKVVLNNMEKKLQTTSWLSETAVKPLNCPKNNCVLDLFQHKLIWRLLQWMEKKKKETIHFSEDRQVTMNSFYSLTGL